MTSILFGIVSICSSLFKCTYVKNENFFPHFLFYWWNLHQLLDILTKKMTVIANLFPLLQAVKDLVRPLSKKHRVRTCFDSQHVKVSQALVKSAWQDFYHTFPSLWTEMILQVSPWIKYGVFELLFNKLTAYDKYLFDIARICSFLFKRNYFEYEHLFLSVLFHFCNLH